MADDQNESSLGETSTRRLLAEALRFGRMPRIKRDPRECPACGKPWPTIADATECCEPMGVAIASALDAAEVRERGGWAPAGSTALIESDLRTPGNRRRDECMSAFSAASEPGAYGPIHRLVSGWQRELAGDGRTAMDDAEKKRIERVRWVKAWRERMRRRRKRAGAAA